MASPTIYIPGTRATMPPLEPAEQARLRLRQSVLTKLAALTVLIVVLAYFRPFLAT